jgi:hypothetical protein
MLDNIYTIKGKNGEVKQGALTWIDHECFWFHDGINRFWGKTDFWEIIGRGVKIFKM